MRAVGVWGHACVARLCFEQQWLRPLKYCSIRESRGKLVKPRLGSSPVKRTESLRAWTAFPRLVMRNLWEAPNYPHFFVLPASFTLSCYKQLRVGWEYLPMQSQEIRCCRLTIPSETSVIVGLVLKYWLLELEDFLKALFSFFFSFSFLNLSPHGW